jgi:small subunit ribosomal protein S10e
MIVSKKDRIAVYSFLFKEGIIVTKKITTIEHPELKISNLIVVKLMLSLKTRGYVRENFCWAHHYFYLTDEGITYLREYLHLPEEIIPATLKKATPAARPVGARQPQDETGKDSNYQRDRPPRTEGGGGGGRRDFKSRS